MLRLSLEAVKKTSFLGSMELFFLRSNRKWHKTAAEAARQGSHRHVPCRAWAARARHRYPFIYLYPRAVLLALACALLLLLSPTLLDSVLPAAEPEPPEPEPPEPTVTLLIWWLPFGNRYPLPDCAATHGVRGCTITSDRGAYARADALIVHHRELGANRGGLPRPPRPPAQKWVWMNFESPSHSGRLDGLDGTFNLTMSYRVGSDIFLPYGYLHRYRGNGRRGLRGAGTARKRGLVAWVISNWSEHQERVRFYQKLRRYVRVDVYGRRARPLVNDSVVQTVSAYKFYLAFENSRHTDYITEKLWRNALLAGAVPVVLGPPRENYERFLPADAFIHVEDFTGPRALAAYLAYLDRHPAQYRRYLAWRRDYSVHVTSFWSEHYCAACLAVRASKHQNKTVNGLAFWFES